jgi:hypothetical protein
MDPGIGIVYEVLRTGGPFAVSVLLFYMWREERKEKNSLREDHEKLQGRVLENAIAQTQAMTKLEASIIGLKDVLNTVLNRLS